MNDAKKKIINRLKTIKGHIAGIEKMIEEDKPCEDILLQIAAIKSSVHKVGIVIMEEHAMQCMVTDDDGNLVDKKQMENVIKTLLNYSK
ncbi:MULTISPECIES: metal-sensitive transcriptional regulator [unclassified Fusibacter]|uniref:metal-sensitive transcriptional regulator n=1 Tax=unclassified Fusibacter TaxID=2624464 RepID=UPI001010AF11|nr:MULTISPECIES: metal-sensitive transcriptional regulator [unclassified Fusibacter]MCK8059237.1 metal-sensitive transcriptional regulator [Fusibacter sp. A2]NPE21299.1 metal-sensitive transcriptional regulator [Fusibacter sp. A1]RXV62563.1 transcriptional regulator [Fusibacter sp. A1]